MGFLIFSDDLMFKWRMVFLKFLNFTFIHSVILISTGDSIDLIALKLSLRHMVIRQVRLFF